MKLHKKKWVRIAVFGSLFALCTAFMSVPSYADPETSTEATDEAGTMTVSDAGNVSSDCSLSSLKIAQASLSPDFAPGQLTYTATVSYDVTRITVSADTASPQAKKIINGTGDLEVGENVVTIVVTAQSGAVREYRITVTREEQPAQSGETGEGEVQPGGSESAETPSESVPESTPESTQVPSASESVPMTGETGQTDEIGETGETGETADPLPLPGETDGSDPEKETGSFLSRRNLLILILVLCIFCLVLVFVIIAALLLRHEPGEDDEDETADDEDETADDEDETADGDEDEARDEDQKRDDAGAVTAEELARFYHALNIAEESEQKGSGTAKASAEAAGTDTDIQIVDFDDVYEDDPAEEDAKQNVSADITPAEDDSERLEEDDDFDFLDF